MSLLLTFTLATSTILGETPSTTQRAPDKTIVETAVAAGSFTTLTRALQAADLVEALGAKGPFTVFAPTDAAFAALPKGTLEHLLTPEGRDTLVSILTLHVAPGRFVAADLLESGKVDTLAGPRLLLTSNERGVFVDGARVTSADVAASNGVIHVVDKVLMPPKDTLVGVARGAGTFTTLLAAAQAAGLVEALSGKGPLTVFAPTDAAFAAIPKDRIAALLDPKNKDALVTLLTYHVVPGRVFADQVVARGSLETLQGGTLTLSVRDGTARIGGAGLTATDIQASNGVIHVVDAVLVPEGFVLPTLDTASVSAPHGDVAASSGSCSAEAKPDAAWH